MTKTFICGVCEKTKEEKCRVNVFIEKLENDKYPVCKTCVYPDEIEELITL